MAALFQILKHESANRLFVMVNGSSVPDPEGPVSKPALCSG
jgi:hypothetical protein